MFRSSDLSYTQSASVAHSFAFRASRVLAATLVLALAAHISFPLPFTPVPFTMQPLAVLAAGLLLGPVEGALALLAYLCEGLAGLPVFSPVGPGGLAQLLGPTGGYLLADPLVAFVAGWGAGRASMFMRPYLAALFSSAIAITLLFACGAAWLAHLIPMSAHHLWMAAVLPFLPGEAIKVFIAAGLYRTFSEKLAR